MKDKKNALLLSSVCFFALWLILFLISVTERGAIAYNFMVVAGVAAFAGIACAVCWLVLDTAEKRENAAGIFDSLQYWALKRKAKKDLHRIKKRYTYGPKNAPRIYMQGYNLDVDGIEEVFYQNAHIMGIDLLTMQEDFADILEEVKSVSGR